ncbi:MAG TPA: LptF/LptG family permease, partial [Gammaproteobacteria bacterium]|nr:LptF/LptG family permease [Gammaproteobacteria bacterium]
PLAAVCLVLLALPLSRTTPREGRFGRLFGAVLIFIVYYNLLGTSQVWVEKGVLGTLPGLWWVHALPVLATLVLFYAARMRAPRRPKLRGGA